MGDTPSAVTWRDIAAAVNSITEELLVQIGRSSN
jgi:UDP-N-acetylglucosamine transferase subunit ALG13